MASESSLCPFPVLAVSEVVTSPEKLRIGPEKNNYVYSRVNKDAYVCERPSDDGDKDTQVLWLVRNSDGVWVAFDGPAVFTSVPDCQNPVFESEEDVLVEGWHDWKMLRCKDGSQKSSFKTTLM